MLWKKDGGQREDLLYVNLLDRPSVNRIYERCQKGCDLMKCMYPDSYKKSATEAIRCRQKGNEVFAAKKWADAMEWYNRSMCFAEEGSELMGLAFANRSSCFFNMKMYSKCLIDIEHAKQNNYPQEKLAKLDERKTICLATMEKEADQSEIFEPKLDYAPNEKYPCLANVLEIKNNRRHGRHIVANEDIDVGQTVMVDESYFAETFNLKYRRCGICFRETENLKPCNKCTFAMFCRRCEGNSFHDIECVVNPVYFGSILFESYRMVVVRSILLAMNAFADIGELMAAVEEMLSNDTVEVPDSISDAQSKYRAFFKLQLNPEPQVELKLPQKIYFIYRMLMDHPDVSKFFHSNAHKRFLMHLIGHHVIMIKNRIRSDLYKTGRIGWFGEEIEMFWEHRMSIPASFFNHSCSPNCYITVQNGINVCVVVRPVRKGEQLCVTYDDEIMMAPKAERQRDLQSKFNFQCKCDRCEQPRLEASSLQSNLWILTDPNLHAFERHNKENGDIRDFKNILSLKAKAFGLLKKYKNVAYSKEIYDIIYKLYGISLTETESAVGRIPFTGRFHNIPSD